MRILGVRQSRKMKLMVVQALLSSSIMFSNFMSIYQRRAEAKEKAEQSNRCSPPAYLHTLQQ